jgi:pyruvate kinase
MNLSPPSSSAFAGRRAKIVCTLGPASRSAEAIDSLMRAGMNVARLNFSHGSYDEHTLAVQRIRAASGRYQIPIAILADLPGPKIRTGTLEERRPIQLRTGQKFVISTQRRAGTTEGVSVNYPRLAAEVRRGDRILLADGVIELRVESTTGRRIVCRVVNGGTLGEHKGVNLPGVRLRVPALTPADRRHLDFALRLGVNYIGVSFVRTAADIVAARVAIQRAGYTTPVIAKLEKPEAIDNLDAILEVTDGVMVARGDLGVEMSPERVPVVQKLVISRAREAMRPVITATQMLESMTERPRPTRAEASDVANAVFDGTDAVMLSAETAAGRYPVESVQMMDRIIREAEAHIKHRFASLRHDSITVADATADLICHASEQLSMKVIAVFTQTGSSARLISKHRPNTRVIAFSPNQETRRRMSLYWGVLPRRSDLVENIEGMAAHAEQRLLEEKLVARGDIVGIVAGIPFGVGGATNLVKFHVVGLGSRAGTRVRKKNAATEKQIPHRRSQKTRPGSG